MSILILLSFFANAETTGFSIVLMCKRLETLIVVTKVITIIIRCEKLFKTPKIRGQRGQNILY